MSPSSPQSWNAVDPDELPPLKGADWLRVVARGLPLGIVTFGCLGLLLLVRLIEAPLFGSARPWTPRITMFVCRSAFVLLGMGHRVHGTAIRHGAVVANHASWLDIFALNARQAVYFVSKSEVAGWPGIGWLARATGTVFINRRSGEARDQRGLLLQRLLAGHLLLFFPEGTSTDGRRVLPFKSTLFAAFYDEAVPKDFEVQPVTVLYHAPDGQSERFYGWWGDMDFGPHLLRTLAAPRNGSVEIWYHPPLKVADYPDRKAMAEAAGAIVRETLERQLA